MIVSDTCPVCQQTAFVGGIGLEYTEESGHMLLVQFFCDRTKGCIAVNQSREDPWISTLHLDTFHESLHEGAG